MKHVAAILILFASIEGYSQTRSFDVWSSISTGGEVFKDFSVSIEEGVRLSDFNQSLWYQDLTAKYAFNKYFKLAATWRYGGRGHLFDVDAIDNRFQIDANGKYEVLKDLEIGLRARYQKRYRDMFVSDDGLLSADYLRLRPALGYKISSDISVDGGFEAYFQTNNEKGNFMDKYRIYAGVEFDLGDYHELGVSYIFQNEIQVPNPHANNIVSLAYSFKLDKFIQKRKTPVQLIDEQIINWYRLPGN